MVTEFYDDMGYLLKKSLPPVYRTARLGSNDLIEIQFSYNSALVTLIKTLPEWRWGTKERTWFVPVGVDIISALRDCEFSIDRTLEDWEAAHLRKERLDNLKIPGLRATLHEFQQEGVEGIVSFNSRALLADDMGLGKTVQAIAWLQLNKLQRPAVILCPASLKEMWARAISKWMKGKEKVHIISGKPPAKGKVKLPKADIYILNYDIVGNKVKIEKLKSGKKKRTELHYTGWTDYLVDLKPKMIVADEAHKLKNKNSQRSIGGLRLIKKAPMALPMTGTPIENRPAEFWPILNALYPSLFKNFFKFAKEYCKARHNGFGWDFTGASNTGKLNKLLLGTCMIRRLKSEVLKQLPPKQRAVVPLPMTLTKIKRYKRAELELAECDEGDKISVLGYTIALKQACNAAKMDAACEWIGDFLESGEKLIVFAHHHAVVDALKEKFSKVTKIAEVTGRTKGSKQDQEDLFQNDPDCGLFIGSKSAIEGLTLTASSNTAFFEIFDTPGAMAQAEDRNHRIGQESSSVNVWYLVAADTVDEDSAKMVDKKLRVIKAIVDGEEAQSEEMITFLLKSAKKRIKEQNASRHKK